MEEDSCKIGPQVGEEEFEASCAKQMALLALMEKTGYNMIQENGQRKYGPPPGVWLHEECLLYKVKQWQVLKTSG